MFDEQSDVRDMLRGQTTTQWVFVSTGMFTSFLFDPTFGLVDLELAKVHALGRWSNRLTVTTSSDIGRLTAAILALEPRIENEVVYVAGDTFSYTQLADIVDRHLGRDVERVLWDMDRLRSEATAHPDAGMRKYRLAFARDTGVAWDKDRTFNFAQGIDVSDVPGWLDQRDPCEMSPSRPTDYPQLGDAAAVAFARHDMLFSTVKDAALTADLAATYYGFWNNGTQPC